MRSITVKTWSLVLWLSPCLLGIGCGVKNPLKPRPLQTTDALHEYVSDARARHQQRPLSDASLWHDGARSPYIDFKARQRGDIVIIRVVEETDASSEASTATERGVEFESGVGRLLGVEKIVPGITNIAGGKATQGHEGSGSTTRKNTLETTVAARVVDVLPNDTLVVQGSRLVSVNHETQRVTLVGIVRPSDIDGKGEVDSTRVADLELILDGRGVVSESERPGWLLRLLAYALPL